MLTRCWNVIGKTRRGGLQKSVYSCGTDGDVTARYAPLLWIWQASVAKRPRFCSLVIVVTKAQPPVADDYFLEAGGSGAAGAQQSRRKR
jgi:hypothetical protein